MTSEENNIDFGIAEEYCAGCQRCQLTCSMIFNNVFNPALSYIKVLQTTNMGVGYEVSRTEDCVECGSCVDACAFGCLT